jgi:hypothetical protein
LRDARLTPAGAALLGRLVIFALGLITSRRALGSAQRAAALFDSGEGVAELAVPGLGEHPDSR